MIPIFSNSLGEEELDAVHKVFDSKWLGKGKECESFEKELADYWHTDNVLLCNNCTAGLYLALKALGIGRCYDNEVIIPTIHFVGAVNAIIEAGAVPVFADVDPRTLNILPGEIERLRTVNTEAVMLLHYGGNPCTFDWIENEAKGLLIIEDSANSVDSWYKGKACGTLGDIGVFSFDAMKILVTGDGGAITVKDKAVYEKLKVIRYLGFKPGQTSGTDAVTKENARWWEFDVTEPSLRYIANDITAAIGRVQLRKLPGFIKRRKEIWDYYQKELREIVEIPPNPVIHTKSSYYLYWIRTDKRDALAKYLYEHDIYTTYRYFPLHKVFKKYVSRETLPNADKINDTCLNLPLHQNLNDNDVEKIVKTIKEFYGK